MDRIPDVSEAEYEEAAEHDEAAADDLARQRLRDGRDPLTGEVVPDLRGVLSHDRKDALEAAAIAAGIDVDDIAHLGEMNIEQLQEHIATLEAKRIAGEVKPT